MKTDFIPYGKQDITAEDIIAVTNVLKSDYWTQGPSISEFENKFSEYVGSKYAIAVSNGTAALHLSVLSLGLKPGQKVITTPITFAASANCIRYCGAEVVFADIDPSTYLIDIQSVEKLLKKSPEGTYAGIIPVDFAGRAVNMEDFKRLADKYNCWILEDSCHAPGAYFTKSDGSKSTCGSSEFADLAIFSFHPVKHIAAGEGGMVTTNSFQLYNKIKVLRSHGIVKESSDFLNSAEFANGGIMNSEYPGWYMEMQELGFNYRLTDIQAALGISQLSRAHIGLERRRLLAKNYYQSLKDKSYIKNQSGLVDGHAYHLYILEVKNRLGLYDHLKSQKINTQIHYIPCHLMPYYRELGWKEGDLQNAESYYKECISLPMYPSLSEKDQKRIIRLIIDFYEG